MISKFLNYFSPIFILIGICFGFFTKKTQDENHQLNKDNEALNQKLTYERELNQFTQDLKSKSITDKRRELSAHYAKRK